MELALREPGDAAVSYRPLSVTTAGDLNDTDQALSIAHSTAHVDESEKPWTS
jgi:hypothetical protein